MTALNKYLAANPKNLPSLADLRMCAMLLKADRNMWNWVSK